jgi:hypothetical protein
LPTSQSLAGNTTSLADLPSEQNVGLLNAHAFDYVRRIGCEFVFDHVQTPLFAERIQLTRVCPDDSRTGANFGAFPTFPQDRYEVWTAISALASPNGV